MFRTDGRFARDCAPASHDTSRSALLTLSLTVGLVVSACGGGSPEDDAQAAVAPRAKALAASTPATSGSIARAKCGPGSSPETALQGQVPLADRQSGRSQQGYRCNLERVGHYQGEGASWVNPFYRNCAYMATTFSGTSKKSPGVQVVDLTNPAAPVFTTNLISPAMLTGPWESLKTSEARGLLAGVAVGPGEGAAFFDVYDLNANCAAPVLQNTVRGLSIPANAIGHEGNWAPDGKTYWASGLATGSLTAIDVSNPKSPRIVYTGTTVVTNHGFALSPDGNRLYLATAFPSGVAILDVSDVQKRALVPLVRQIGFVTWTATGVAQMTIPVTWNSKPYLIAADEFDSIRIIDISDETKPVVVNFLRLEIQRPENASVASQDTAGTGLFGYTSHYCTVDRRDDPTALACGFFNSGVRVLNIIDPLSVSEIAYYNPPAQVGKNALLQGSEHANGVAGSVAYTADLTADWCSSMPRFVGTDQLWVTCQDNGVQVLRFTNNVYKRATNSNNPKNEIRTMDD